MLSWIDRAATKRRVTTTSKLGCVLYRRSFEGAEVKRATVLHFNMA